MRTLLSNLLRGEKHTTDRYIYYDHTIEDQVKEAVEKTLINQEKKIPLRTTIEQEMKRLDEAEITIHAKHCQDILNTEKKLDLVRGEISDAKNLFTEHVQAEMEILPDKMYEKIDKVEANLKRMEAQKSEMEEYNVELNNQDHEKED